MPEIPTAHGPGGLLRVRNLSTHFPLGTGGMERAAKAVDNVSLGLDAGETLGVVGESGCGKTMLALSILGLTPPPGRVVAGEVLFAGRDLLKLSEDELRTVRGREAAMIFQEPMTSLNPVFTVGEQVAEPYRVHLGLSKREALARAEEMLAKVGIPRAGERLASYPHELSGGMRQRVVIAMALALSPKLILADEPTTALDVTIQAQILALMLGLARDLDTAILMITHDLGVVAQVCSRVLVMYAGRVVEEAAVGELFRRPLHPYTQGLLASLPGGLETRTPVRRELTPIPGSVPSLANLPTGCAFNPRCPKVFARCRQEVPPLLDVGAGRARCWLHA